MPPANIGTNTPHAIGKRISGHSSRRFFFEKDYSVLDTILTSSHVFCGVSDAKLVQIGCNNGHEILSAFALGTRVGLGIDQSAPFVEDATKLRDISGHN